MQYVVIKLVQFHIHPYLFFRPMNKWANFYRVQLLPYTPSHPVHEATWLQEFYITRYYCWWFQFLRYLLPPNKQSPSWLGPNAITTNLSDDEIEKRVREAIENVPHAVGMNNHMGSKIVEDEHIMRIILKIANEHQFYFLDSGTSPQSVIPKIAQEFNMPINTEAISISPFQIAKSSQFPPLKWVLLPLKNKPPPA